MDVASAHSKDATRLSRHGQELLASSMGRTGSGMKRGPGQKVQELPPLEDAHGHGPPGGYTPPIRLGKGSLVGRRSLIG